jgi:hypothetical protein
LKGKDGRFYGENQSEKLSHGKSDFFGEIISTYTNKDCVTNGIPDPMKIQPIVLMGFNYYNFGKALGGVFKEGEVLKEIKD